MAENEECNRAIQWARDNLATDDLEIDDHDVKTSQGDDGMWVQAWVWVRREHYETKPEADDETLILSSRTTCF